MQNFYLLGADQFFETLPAFFKIKIVIAFVSALVAKLQCFELSAPILFFRKSYYF